MPGPPLFPPSMVWGSGQSKAQAREGGTDPLKGHTTQGRKEGRPGGAVLPGVGGIQPLVVPWPQVQLAAIASHVVSFIRMQGIQCNAGGGHPAAVRPSPGPSPRIFPAPGSAAPALCPRVRGAPPPPSHVGTQRPGPSLGPPGARSPVRTRAAAGPPPVDWLGLPCSPPMGARLRGWRLAGRARLPLQTETEAGGRESRGC